MFPLGGLRQHGAIFELPGRRERVKKLRLLDNPQPLKALQKDLMCVR